MGLTGDDLAQIRAEIREEKRLGRWRPPSREESEALWRLAAEIRDELRQERELDRQLVAASLRIAA